MQMKDKDFDLLMRSMLENAEEEVSPEVWSAVSSRVRKKPAGGLVFRILGTVSVAAAIAIGAFIGLRNNNINTQSESVMLAEAQPDISEKVKEKVYTNPYSKPDETEPKSLSDNGLHSDRVVKDEQSSVSDANTIVEESSIVFDESETMIDGHDVTSDKQVSGAESKSVVEDKNHNKSTDNNVGKLSDEIDPFALMQYEDSKKISDKHPSFSFGGNLQSNASPASSSARRLASADRTLHKQTNVSQTSRESTYSLPVTFGLTFKYPVFDKVDIGTGISYSLLERTFTGIYTEVEDDAVTRKISADIHNSIHYIGIPLNIYYNVFDNGRFGCYAFIGGSVEKAILNRYRIKNSPNDIFFKESVKGVQFSSRVGFGIDFNISNGLALYVDPSLHYYYGENQPTSIRTQQPLMFNFEIGLRLKL